MTPTRQASIIQWKTLIICLKDDSPNQTSYKCHDAEGATYIQEKQRKDRILIFARSLLLIIGWIHEYSTTFWGEKHS